MTMNKLEKILWRLGFASMIVAGTASLLKEENIATIGYGASVALLSGYIISSYNPNRKQQ